MSTFGPMYAPQPLVVPIRDEFATSASATAWVLGAATLALAAGVIPLGALSARTGRVPVMRTGLALILGGGALTGLAANWSALLAARAITGLGVAAVIVSAMAWVVEHAEPVTATVIGGLYISGTSVGGMSGRLIAGFVAEPLGWRPGVLVSVLVATVVGVAAQLLLPGTDEQVQRSGPATASTPDPNTGFRRVVYLIGFVNMTVFVGLFTVIAFRVAEPPFGAGPAVTGMLYLTYLAGTFTSAISGRLVRRASISRVLVTGFIVIAGGAAIMGLPNLIAVVVGMLVVAAGFFANHGLANSLAPRYSPRPSSASARYSLAYYAGSTAGAVGLGWAWDAGGWPLVMVVAMLGVGLGVLLSAAARPAPEVDRLGPR